MSVFVLLGAALRKEMTGTLPHLGLVQIHSVCNSMKHYNLTIIHRIWDFYVCLFSHKIGALQGIGSRRSVPVEGLGAMFLAGCHLLSCLAADK